MALKQEVGTPLPVLHLSMELSTMKENQWINAVAYARRVGGTFTNLFQPSSLHVQTGSQIEVLGTRVYHFFIV